MNSITINRVGADDGVLNEINCTNTLFNLTFSFRNTSTSQFNVGGYIFSFQFLNDFITS